MGIIEAIEAEGMKENVPQFNVGDTVKVGYRIIEGGKERVQNFEGVVIAKKNGGIRETFTVRRISFGIGVERCFPLHSPKVAYVTVVKAGKVRQALLFERAYGKSGENQRKEISSCYFGQKRKRGSSKVDDGLRFLLNFFGQSAENPFTICLE